MKKNWFLRIGLIALVLTVATTCLVGGTFAKYTTTVSGADTIQVARFGFKATDGATSLTPATATLNLFDNAAAAAEGSVATQTSGTGLMFAPGVNGTFAIVLDNTNTDVDVVIASTITTAITSNAAAYTNDNFSLSTEFIKFDIDTVKAFNDTDNKITYSTTATSLTGFATEIKTAVDNSNLSKNTIKTIYVAYIWENSNGVENAIDDELDSKIGAAVAAAINPVLVELTIKIVATQIME